MANKIVLGTSIAFHAAIGLLIARIQLEEMRAATAIEIAEAKKQEVAKKRAAEPERKPPPAKKPARRTPAPPRPSEPPKAGEAQPLAALPDFGFELSGSVGGLAVAVAPAALATAAPTVTRAPVPVVKQPIARGPLSVPCAEPPRKPKPLDVPQPEYPERARAAGIEGKVRVELSVDENGRVSAVRVLQGLGYGLDEAAVEAAERARFAPALRCGKPAPATFTISMRFSAL